MTSELLNIALPSILESIDGMSKDVRKEFFFKLGRKIREGVEGSDTPIDDKVLDSFLETDIPALIDGLKKQQTDEASE